VASIVRVRRRGTVTLPKALRDQLGIREGSRLAVEVKDGAIVLKPLKAREPPTVKLGPELVEDLLSAGREAEEEKLRAGIPQSPAREAEKAGLDKLVEALEKAYSRGGGSGVNELLEALKAVSELEKVYGFVEARRAGEGSLKAGGLLVIREYVKEALYRRLTGGDPSSLLGEALSVAKALRELEALADKGAEIIGLEDLEVVGYVEGKPVYSLKRRNSPDK